MISMAWPSGESLIVSDSATCEGFNFWSLGFVIFDHCHFFILELCTAIRATELRDAYLHSIQQPFDLRERMASHWTFDGDRMAEIRPREQVHFARVDSWNS